MRELWKLSCTILQEWFCDFERNEGELRTNASMAQYSKPPLIEGKDKLWKCQPDQKAKRKRGKNQSSNTNRDYDVTNLIYSSASLSATKMKFAFVLSKNINKSSV